MRTIDGSEHRLNEQVESTRDGFERQELLIES
jgi:hypothetical protein